jgi:3-oxoacid CoA-transferase subunit B
MEHTTKDGRPKIVRRCALPLTGAKVAHAIVTDLAYLDVAPTGLVLKELAPGATVEEIRELTEASLTVAPRVSFYRL